MVCYALVLFQYDLLHPDENSKKPQLPASGADSLIIVSHNAAASMLNGLWSYLKGSGAFSIYCPTIEVLIKDYTCANSLQPLAELLSELQRTQRAVQLGLSESWLRDYQVCPTIIVHMLINFRYYHSALIRTCS